MTIAAGLLCRDGVLLCTDSQFEAGDVKTFGSWKQGSFGGAEAGFGLGYALAGNEYLATAAIEKCTEALLKAEPTDDPLAIVERCLHKQYRKNVLSHPLYGQDHGLPYQILWGYGRHGQASLHLAWETVLVQRIPFQFCGIGQSMAEHIMPKSYSPSQDVATTVCMAAYVFAAVKKQVPGCGGPTRYTLVRRDGTCDLLWDMSLARYVEDNIEKFMSNSLDLFFSNFHRDREQFDSRMKHMAEELADIRKQWEHVISTRPHQLLEESN